jgi:transposase InsO family protein
MVNAGHRKPPPSRLGAKWLPSLYDGCRPCSASLCPNSCLYKTELIKPRKPWRTIDEVELATAEWVDWFNLRRLYEYCGDIPPVDMEAAYYAPRVVVAARAAP